MSISQQSDSIENRSETPHVYGTPASQRGGKKRPNKKRRCRLRTSVEDDSFCGDSFSPSAFWQNYQKAFQWGNNQEVAYWRSRAVALELENNMLRLHIKRLSLNDEISVPPCVSSPVEMPTSSHSDQGRSNNMNTHSRRKRKKQSKRQIINSTRHQREEEPIDDNHDSQLEFEVTEEMKDFFELHMRHKVELEKKQLEDEKKYEEAASAAGEENAKLISQPMNFGARSDELKLLYGDASPTIHGMETAIQLTFRRHCEKTGARLWPNIPLRL